MVDDGYKKKFLEIEDSASTLLEEIQGLQKEIGGYSAAGKGLERASEDLRALAATSEQAIEKLGQLASTLDEVEVEGVLRMQKKIDARFSQLEESLARIETTTLPEIEASLGGTRSWVIVVFFSLLLAALAIGLYIWYLPEVIEVIIK